MQIMSITNTGPLCSVGPLVLGRSLLEVLREGLRFFLVLEHLPVEFVDHL